MGKQANRYTRVIAYISDGRYFEKLIPADSEGVYFLENPSLHRKKDILEHAWIEVERDNIELKIDDTLRFINPDYSQNNTRVLTGTGSLALRGERIKILIYVSQETSGNARYSKFFFKYPCCVNIGRSDDNDIIYPFSQTSSHHASLKFDGNQMELKDYNSRNGTYLNGRIVDFAILKPGDKVHIGGMDIIIGSAFIGINLSGSIGISIRVNSEKMERLIYSMVAPGDHEAADKPREFFSRYPRRRIGLSEKHIQVDSPPYSMDGNQMPLLLRMGSSLVMSGTSAMMGNYTMLLTSLLFPFLTSKYTEKEKKEYERMRYEQYTAYLKRKSEEISQQIIKEEKTLNTNYPPNYEVIKYADMSNKLWNRKISDDDFLNIRVGSGEQEMSAKIEYQSRDFSMIFDDLEKKMLALVDHKMMLENIPVMVDFKENRVTSVIANSKTAVRFMENIIWRLSMLYSYDELKMIFVMDKSLLSQMEYLRYLPHVWTDDYSMRFIASTSAEAYQISDYLSKEMENREIKEKTKNNVRKVHYLIIAQNKKLYDEIEALKSAINDDSKKYISVITFFPELPKESKVYIRVHTNKRNKITYLEDLNREVQYFDTEYLERNKALGQVRKLSSIQLKTVQESSFLPSSIGFLELFNVQTISDLHIRQRWKESNPIKSLAAPIGVGTDGSLFTLDLHQKYQGPHGLVAGTTGSGKSEFLITYILSLTINYHPDEVAFVLIDYKGGGLAGAFSNPEKNIFLPHVIGTITNLDGSTIQRAITSIEAELERRQRVFNEAKNLSDEGTMDIYQYQRLYRSGVLKTPIPHLFIISDEFAELKQKEPAFLDKLVSAARIGRSLGVHLILATQRPSGVVNDQILSNTKFRVCLKVQDRSDSNDMIKRPDAAELKEPGRFYLQVGYNEYFALGQSAWCGAPYNPQASVSDRDMTIKFVDLTGNVTHVAGKARKENSKNLPSQLVSIVEEISKIAKQDRINVRQLWLPPLPFELDLENPERKEERSNHNRNEVWVGDVDDPKRQRQFSYWVDLSKQNNCWIVGTGRSGKSTLLESMIFQMAEYNTPNQINFYILDFSGNHLKKLAMLPHCGQLISEGEIEQADKFFELIDSLVEDRKKEIEDLDVTDFENARTLKELPVIFVIIDDIGVLKSTNKGERLYFKLVDYLKIAPKLGFQYLITSSNIGELGLKHRNEINLRITCSLNDRFEYEEVLGTRVLNVVPDKPGRGIVAISGESLEIQMPRFASQINGAKRNRSIENKIIQICEKYQGYIRPKGFPHIPKDQTYEDFEKQFDIARIPLGYEIETAKAIALPLLQFSMLGIYFGGERANEKITASFLKRFSKEQAEIHIFKANYSFIKEELVDELKRAGAVVFVYDSTLEGLTQLWQKVTVGLEQRLALHKSYCEKMGYERFSEDKDHSKRYIMNNSNPICIWIEGFYEFLTLADDATKMTFDLLFERGPYWNMYFIGTFYPDTISSLGKYPLYSKFTSQCLSLAVGGQFSRQKLLTVSREYVSMKKDEIPNFAAFRYRGIVHNMLIPCGVFEAVEEDPDEKSIF